MPLSCARMFCSKPAPYRPVLVLRTSVALDGSADARMTVPLPICPACLPDIGVPELVNDEGWKLVAQVFLDNGRPVPDPSLTTVEWEPWA